MEMTPQRWEFLSRYAAEIFGRQDRQLATLMSRAVEAGLPDIAVSPDVGRLLNLLASMTNAGRGASLIVEVGTLGGYSGIWLARALAPGGRLITIEPEPAHADFAQREFTVAGLANRVELIRAPALEALPALAERLGESSVDAAFIDAVKTEYPDYFRLLRPLIKPGGLFIADNALGSSWTMDQPPGSSPERDAVDHLNRTLAADRDFDAACILNRQGLLVARRL